MPVPADPRDPNRKGEEQSAVEEENNHGQEQGFQLFAKYPAGDHKSDQAEYQPAGPDVDGVPAGEYPDRTAADQCNNDDGRDGQSFKKDQGQEE